MRKPTSAELSRAESKTGSPNQAKTVDLAQDLNNLGGWGFNNGFVTTFGSAFPGLGCLAGLLLTAFNPLWIVMSTIFYAIGTAKLKKGDFTGAERALAFGRLTNWLLLFPCFIVWSLSIQSYQSKGAVYRMIHEPKVEIVQSAGVSSATKPASPSIRAEIRQALTGGHVLQVWNNTTKPVRCTATLNNPELNRSPTYSFALEPGVEKPQELGIKQFGHRILRKPRCSVTIKVEGTGETYKYTP